MRKNSLFTLLFCLASPFVFGQVVSDFESLGLADESVWDGSSATLGTFTTDLKVLDATFKNSHTRSDWGYGVTESWSGFAYSKVTDNTTPGYTNQYSAIAGSGTGNSTIYGVVYTGMGLDRITFDSAQTIPCIVVNNATYTYFSMKDGDSFAKKFGGDDGNDQDFLLLKIIGYNDENATDTIDFYLADYRFENNEEDYLVDEWTNLDLTHLGQINSIRFELSSSDNGDWGMNTPAYFCIDNLGTIDFENLSFTSGEYWNGSSAALGTYESTFTDGKASFANTFTLSDWGYGPSGSSSSWSYSSQTDNTTVGFTNASSAIAGSGANGSATYALCYNSFGQETITLEEALVANSIHITNGTYPYYSMKNGDSFAKKFGGDSGNDADFFLLQIFGYLDGQITDTIDFYLADFRFEDNLQDYIIEDWREIDLTPLGLIDQISFSLSSSDNGDWGMNTPAYFFIDDLSLSTSSAIERVEQKSQLTLFPNPCTDYLNISSNKKIDQVELISLTGQVIVGPHQSARGSQNIRIPVSDLISGVYLVRIHSDQRIQTERIIIK